MITHVWLAEEAGGYEPGRIFGIYATAELGMKDIDRVLEAEHKNFRPYEPLAWTNDDVDDYWEASGGFYVTLAEIEGLENTE